MRKYKECSKCLFCKKANYGKENFEYCDLLRQARQDFGYEIDEIFNGKCQIDKCELFKENHYDEELKEAVLGVSESDIEKIHNDNKETPKKGQNTHDTNFYFLSNTLSKLQSHISDTSRVSTFSMIKALEEILKEETTNNFNKQLNEWKKDGLINYCSWRKLQLAVMKEKVRKINE